MSDSVQHDLKELKKEAIASKNENFANSLWAYEQILYIQDKYILAFNHMKSGEFYNGWCCLARVEKAIYFLTPHYRSAYKGFHVEFISDVTAKFQLLFPYRLFFSIEAVNKLRTCSICGTEIKLRSSCGHKPGHIYNGECCARIVHKLDVPAISLVTNPEDKCCVAFAGGGQGKGIEDNYDYFLVSYPLSKLRSPFDLWNFAESKLRQDHSHYADVAHENPCPCESGTCYADCCLSTEGVLRPHYQFTFDVTDKAWESEFLFVKGQSTTPSKPVMSEQNAMILNTFVDKLKNY